MSISIQQIRSAIPGAQPAQLDPGQVAFNVSDGTMYLGTGTDTKIDFSGELVLPAPPAGKGWLQVLLQRDALDNFFINNPSASGQPDPENEQVLTWDSVLGIATWQDAGTGFAYATTSDTVAASIGATTSEKISAAIGSPSYIGKNASCIVEGNPGSTYEGLYIWDGSQWQFASHYAFNTASQVPALNPMTQVSETTQEVLGALKDVDVNLQGQIVANDGEIATLQGQVATAQTDITNLQANKLDKASNVPVGGQILSFDGTGQLWVDNSAGDVTSVSGVTPINVDNTNPQTPIVSVALATNGNPGVVQIGTNINNNVGTISVSDATTSGKGVVQLVNTLDSTSTTQALTAAAGASLQTQINALSLASNVTLAGGFDATAGVMDSVTTQGLAAGFAVGDPLPDPTTVADYYVIVTNAGTQTLLGAKANGDAENGDWYLSDGVEWQLLGVGARPGTASYTSAGIVQLADASVVYAGTSDTEAITPDALFSNMSDSVVLADSHKIASSLAVKTASDTATTALNSATTANNAANAAQSTANQAVLDAAAAQSTANDAIPKATFTAAGQLLYGTGAATYNVLPLGVDNQVLTITGGNLVWAPPANSLSGFTTATNTALGLNSLDALTTGVDNVAVGVNTGTSLTGGSRNVFVGDECGDGTTTGNNNVAIGYQAFSATGGSNNVVIGNSAGATMTVGNSNTIIGSSAGDALTGANAVVAIGQAALSNTATATGTVAIGQSALQNLTSGSSNTAVGYQTGDTLTTGSGNTLLGFNAGTGLQTGGNNILIGAQAGDSITTGSNNTIIGDISGSGSLANNLIIGVGSSVRFQSNANGAINFDGTNYGTAGQVLTSQGQGSAVTWSTPSGGLLSQTTVNATGSSVTIPVPAGTNRAVIVVNNISYAGDPGAAADLLLAVGGVPVTSGYQLGVQSSAGTVFATDGFLAFGVTSAAVAIFGQFEMYNVSGNTWSISGQSFRTSENVYMNQVGITTLAGALSDLVFNAGNSTFDAGFFTVKFYS